MPAQTSSAKVDTHLNCPSCGGDLRVQYRFSRMVICEYCGQTNYLNAEQQLDPRGPKQTPLVDYGSKLRKGSEGTINGRAFRVLGRLRYDYPDGFWDEWLIRIEDTPDTEYWLHEDEGEFTLMRKSDAEPQLEGKLQSLKVGQTHNLGPEVPEVFIAENREAWLNGGEGELPFYLNPGEPARFVDGYFKGLKISIEQVPDGYELHIGEKISFDKLVVTQF